MHAHTNHEHSEFRTALREDHEQLFSALEDVLFSDQGASELRNAWEAFEHALLAHLRAEEEDLIPCYELAGPNTAEHIRTEHHGMRELLRELGREFERNLVDRERVARLLGVLRTSAAGKENELYCWAESALRPRNKARVIDRLRASPLSVRPRA
jgi:hypothetical protein